MGSGSPVPPIWIRACQTFKTRAANINVSKIPLLRNSRSTFTKYNTLGIKNSLVDLLCFSCLLDVKQCAALKYSKGPSKKMDVAGFNKISIKLLYSAFLGAVVIAKNVTNISETVDVLKLSSFDFSFSKIKEPNTCKSVDMCRTMKGICNQGKCRTRPCSNDIYCDCPKDTTGMYCDSPIGKATNGKTVKGAIEAGKTHVNGNVNFGKPSTKGHGATAVDNGTTGIVPEGSQSNIIPTNTTPGINETNNQKGKQMTGRENKTESEIITQTTEGSNLSSSQSRNQSSTTPGRSTIHPDGSYIKGPESTYVSDNRPFSLEPSNQTILQTANNQSIKNKTDSVTIPSTILTLSGLIPTLNPKCGNKCQIEQARNNTAVNATQADSSLTVQNEEKLVKIVESIIIHTPKDSIITGNKGTVNIKSKFVDKGAKRTNGSISSSKAPETTSEMNSNVKTTGSEASLLKKGSQIVTTSAVNNNAESTTTRSVL